MFGSSKLPTSRGRGLGDGTKRPPKAFETLKQAHARHGPEDQMSLASRAATTPDMSETRRPPAVTVTGNWMQRATEATNQRLRRMFGRFLHLTPEGAAEVSRVAPIAQEPLRVQTPQLDQAASQADVRQVPAQRLNGISVEHTPLHALAGGPHAVPRDYQPTRAVTEFLAVGSRAARAGQQAAHTLEEVKKSGQSMSRASTKENASRTQSAGQKEQEKDGGVGRGIED